MIRVILFDLGGVVFRDIYSGGSRDFAHTVGVPEQQVLDAYRATDVPAWPEGKISDEARMSLLVHELKLPRERVGQFAQAFNLVFTPIPEVVALIKELYVARKFRLGVLSDQHSGADRYLHERYGEIMQLFDSSVVFISCEVGLAKHEPDLKFFRYAVSRCGVRPDEILLVDDSEANIRHAKSAGMATYFFDRKTQTLDALITDLRKQLA